MAGNKITPDQLADRLAKLPAAMKIEGGKALYQFARRVIEPAAKDNAPFRDGILRASIETLPPEIKSDRVEVRVVAGGPAAPYAIAIHEHLSEHSPPSWQAAEESGGGVTFQVGGPKYLERAVNEHGSKAPTGTASEIQIKNVWEKT